MIVSSIVSNGDAHSGFRDERGLVGFPLAAHNSRLCNEDNYVVGALHSGMPGRDASDAGNNHLVVHTLRASGGSEDGTGPGIPLIVGALQSHTRRHGHAMSTGQAAVDSRQVFPHQAGVRRLTPTECERLQGFPDGWTAIDGMSDSARYRMLGNAVCVPVAQWIAGRIMEAEGGKP